MRDAQGRRISEAAVTVVAASAPVPEIAYLTDADGRIALSLPEGPVRLVAHRGGRSGACEGKAGEPLTVVLD